VEKQELTTKRRYTRKEDVQQRAIDKYKKNGRGITFNDLISYEPAFSKKQAQNMLKRCLRSNILFILENHKPQQYYPTCLKAEIQEHKISKNYPVGVTGVGYYDSGSGSGGYYSSDTDFVNDNNNGSKKGNRNIVPFSIESIARQSLEGYVLPLLPSAPLYIHKMQFKLSIPQEYYDEIPTSINRINKGKVHEDTVGGSTVVSYCFYANGTVVVSTSCSNNPFKLENEEDRSRLMAFFGQVRDRLVVFLHDMHERIVPDIMQWQMTQCDINKDIPVSDWLQFTVPKIQLKNLDHLFRIYIKSKGTDTVCRVEESVSINGSKSNAIRGSPSSSAIGAINKIFNPSEQLENSVEDINRKLDLLLYSTTNNNNSGYKYTRAFPN
jgi:hypothetical protein